MRGPPLPEAGLYLYRWHSEIRRRTAGGFGPGPISWEGIAAWAKVTGRRITPWEAGVLGDLDDKFLIVMSEASAHDK